MLEFLFMLTKSDSTVEDCLDVYDTVRDAELRWVGFKDVGVPFATLEELTRRIKGDGREAVLEIVSISAESELASARAARDLGVDLVMGGTRAAEVGPMLAGTPARYFPFPGQITGHPSVLEGTVAEIVESARDLVAQEGVDGLDLLAYRWAGDVPAMMAEVVAAADRPIVVAGSIASPDRVEAVARAGAWGFTVGGAIFDRAFVPGGTLRDQVDVVLACTKSIGNWAGTPG